MNELYLDAVRRAVGAYSEAKIDEYIADVEAGGIREHGFARLAANIGTLIANGERKDLESRFLRMTDLVCETAEEAKIRNGKTVGNDFSVREICTCIEMLEKAGLMEKETSEWKRLLAGLNPHVAYTKVVTDDDQHPNNWAMFVAASEQARRHLGIGGDEAFIDRQIESQLSRFDENGMYRDPHCPMVYDLVTRALSAFILSYGYNGKWAEELRDNLLKSADLTLMMQSVDGEIPFGGRSNQMLMTEGWYAALCEYYISVLPRDDRRRGLFARNLKAALAFTDYWTSREGFTHVKNFYPADSGIGCEGYAYFEKYMVTTGSVYTLASLLSDGEDVSEFEKEPYIAATSEDFHKIFLNNGKIFAEIETNADFNYDVNGIGRVHFKNAPPALVLSVPCPLPGGRYRTEESDGVPLSICPVTMSVEGPELCSLKGTKYDMSEMREGREQMFLSFETMSPKGNEFFESVLLNEDRFEYTVGGDGKCGAAVPVFLSDGKESSEIIVSDRKITVSYCGYSAVYETDGIFVDTGLSGANRNGKYGFFCALADGGVTLTIRVRSISDVRN
ncbi:MAG: hypothetical protein MJ137_08645 [Clostridia bacterium]|nr:hypothetical protein [Clostridia bacterium]